jgi:hypothetical protein
MLTASHLTGWCGYPQVGTKLLAADVKIASGLALKAMRGNTLTW